MGTSKIFALSHSLRFHLRNAKRALCMCVCSAVSDFGPMDCRPPGSSAPGIFQQEYWSRLPFPSPEDLPYPGITPASPALADGFCITKTPGKPLHSLIYRALTFI